MNRRVEVVANTGNQRVTAALAIRSNGDSGK
jgi:hypothetical protein